MQLREINLLLTGKPETFKGTTFLDLRLSTFELVRTTGQMGKIPKDIWLEILMKQCLEYKMTNWFSKS